MFLFIKWNEILSRRTILANHFLTRALHHQLILYTIEIERNNTTTKILIQHAEGNDVPR